MRHWRILMAALLLAACSSLAQTSTSGSSQGAITAVSGSLRLKITAPQDDAVVNVPLVEVKGEAPPDTVITLNNVIAVADARGAFSATVPLDEGPNDIQVVASDVNGNEVNLEITVTYDSGS